MIGLLHPTDLDAWHAWSRRGPVKRLRSAFNGPALRPPPFVYRNSEAPPLVVVAVSSSSPSARAALLAPLPRLEETSVAVVSEVDLHALLPTWTTETAAWQSLMGDVGAVMGDGNFLDLGHDVWAAAASRGVPYFVSQHGAVTPYAPPLPPDAHLISWNAADGAFWASGRTDLTIHVAGSQLLWDSAERPASRSRTFEPLTFLGQGHSAEVGRLRMIEVAVRFCRRQSAVYRPHPSERDKASRLALAGLRRLGVTVDGSAPLNEMSGPVVSVFSTGVLEAAAQGRDAWVEMPRPPAWLEEFWERYGMRRFGGDRTPPPQRPEIEPALRIATILREAVS